MDLSEKERKYLIQFMVGIGFIIQEKPFMQLKTSEERYNRIKSLMAEGYRIQLWGKDYDVVNIKGKTISHELYEELKEVYRWLTSTTD